MTTTLKMTTGVLPMGRFSLWLIAFLLLTKTPTIAQWIDIGGKWPAAITFMASSSHALFASTAKSVYRSTDGGEVWTAVIDTTAVVYFRSIAVSGDTIYALAVKSGPFISLDGGVSWHRNHAGLPSNLPYPGGYCVTGGNGKAFVGTLDSGVYVLDRPDAAWRQVNLGLDNLSVRALTLHGDTLIAGTGGGVYISANQGDSWSLANNGLNIDDVLSFASGAGKLFTGTWGGLFVSASSPPSWSSISSGPNSPFWSAGNDVTTADFESVVVSGDYIFACTSGGVYFTHDNGVVWRNVITSGGEVNTLMIRNDTLYCGGGLGITLRPVSDFFPPEAPEATAPDISSSASFTANWIAAAGAAAYQLDVARDSLFADAVTGYTPVVPGDSESISGLSGGRYYYRVRAVNEFGDTSPNSNVISFCVSPPTPTISISGNDGFTLHSSAPSGNQWFQDGNAISGANANTFTVTQVGVYTVQVTIGGCSSAVSDDFPAAIAGDINGLQAFALYPNPARDHIFVSGIREPMVSSAVTDITGRRTALKLTRQGEALAGDIGNLTLGVYILEINTGSAIGRVKFIKQ